MIQQNTGRERIGLPIFIYRVLWCSRCLMFSVQSARPTNFQFFSLNFSKRFRSLVLVGVGVGVDGGFGAGVLVSFFNGSWSRFHLFSFSKVFLVWSWLHCFGFQNVVRLLSPLLRLGSWSWGLSLGPRSWAGSLALGSYLETCCPFLPNPNFNPKRNPIYQFNGDETEVSRLPLHGFDIHSPSLVS